MNNTVMDDAKPKRRGRQKKDMSYLTYTPDQMRLKLQKYSQRKRVRFYSGVLANVPKSTTISMREVCMISGINRRRLFFFKKGNDILKPYELEKLCNALLLIESGRVEKHQAGKYTIHDEPVFPPHREMNISLTGGVILPGVSKPPENKKKMPSFDKLFG